MKKTNFDSKDSWNKQPDIFIIVPVFNEGEVIKKVLQALCLTPYRIILVDDSSTDNTLQIAKEFPITVLHHIINLGQGAALQTGFDFVLKQKNAKCVVTFDSDGQHAVDDLVPIISPVITGEYDVVLGSRFLDKTAVGMPLLKLLTLKIGTTFTRLSTGLHVTDTHNGFRAFSFEALKKINITQNRMAHGSEILSKISKYKLKYCEVPVTISYTDYTRRKGQSVLNSINILWDLIFGRDE